MVTLKDFIHRHKLKFKATSNIEVQHVVSSLGLTDVGIYLRDGRFISAVGVVDLHPYPL